jgi:hypothetical protein
LTNPYHLSERKSSIELRINRENPFVRLRGIWVRQNHSYDFDVAFLNCRLAVTYADKLGYEHDAHSLFSGGSNSLPHPHNGAVYFPIGKVLIKDNQFEFIKIHYQSKDREHYLDIILDIETEDLFISMSNPFDAFAKHLGISDNVKILFSAPFGQGKSTFLNHFFIQNKEQYDCFTLFPVNYSVAHNEDIFKYIKADILFELFRKDIEFDKDEFSHTVSGPAYFTSDPVRILSPLIKLIPKIGKAADDVIQSIFEITNKYFNYHDRLQIDDKKAAEEFVNKLYKDEGTIFEDNFFTQLIRQQLQKLKQKTAKDNVLIIEDLDRMDPDHIFRILNVFAAHFDTQEFAQGYTNKFGFDKIILVADYHNLKSIFSYRYGPEVRFDGYMSKYFSYSPFHYDNRQAVSHIFQELRQRHKMPDLHPGFDLLMIVLSDLISAEQITLRDLLKLKKYDINGFVSGKHGSPGQKKDHFRNLIAFNILFLLNQLVDLDILCQKFMRCKGEQQVGNPANYHLASELVIPALVLKKGEETQAGIFRLNEKSISIECTLEYSRSFNLHFYKTQKSRVLGTDGNTTFEQSHFYEILTLCAHRFKELGGYL